MEWRNQEGSAGRYQSGKVDVGRISNAQNGVEEIEVMDMALTKEFKRTVVDRVRQDPEFAKALLDEAATLFLNDEPQMARLILRDLVNATVGFEKLAAETAKPSKSLQRMLSVKGNPSMENLAAIFGVLCRKLGVEFHARAVKAA